MPTQRQIDAAIKTLESMKSDGREAMTAEEVDSLGFDPETALRIKEAEALTASWSSRLDNSIGKLKDMKGTE